MDNVDYFLCAPLFASFQQSAAASNSFSVTLNTENLPGTLSVMGVNECGNSIPRSIEVSLASDFLCELYNCLKEVIHIKDKRTTEENALDIYHAGKRLSSDATIQDFKSIIFKSGTEIALQSEFTVKNGASLVAYRRTCTENQNIIKKYSK